MSFPPPSRRRFDNILALDTEQTPGNEEFTSKDNPLKRRIFRGLKEQS